MLCFKKKKTKRCLITFLLTPLYRHLFFFFQTRFHNIAVADLELATQTSLALSSQWSTCLCLLLCSNFLQGKASCFEGKFIEPQDALKVSGIQEYTTQKLQELLETNQITRSLPLQEYVGPEDCNLRPSEQPERGTLEPVEQLEGFQ